MIQTIKSRIKHLLLLVSGRYSHLRSAVRRTKRWYGNNYGGFYACPTLLDECSIVYSFGIGEDLSFDLAMMKNHNCQVYGFDPTPRSIDWVDGQKGTLPGGFEFLPYGLGDKSEMVDFFLPQNVDHISGSFVKQSNVDTHRRVPVELKALSDIVTDLGHLRIDVLKMDIEGGEYQVLDSILSAPVIIRQILIEFHERFFEDGKRRTAEAVQKLRDHGYEIFAISVTFEEVSFIKRDLMVAG